MTTLLHIASSSNLNGSFTRQIGPLVIERFKKANPALKVTTRDLAINPVPHLSPEMLGAMFSGSNDAPELALSEQLIDELKASDVIVIEAPMYNFSIPSVLKAWIDHVARAGKTFQYSANGPEGLLKGKKTILVVASGGIYSDGPMKAFDFQETYLRGVLGFLGLTDIETIRIEGVALGADKATAALDAAKSQATTELSTIAA